MERLRAILIRSRRGAMMLIVLAIALKALVPAGYMISSESRVLSIAVCHDASGVGTARDVIVPMRKTSGVPGEPAKGECPYGALAMAGLSGADAILLGIAVAFLMALGFAPQRVPRLSRPGYLRPPLRGPPVLI
jgi:hypothetical protein